MMLAQTRTITGKIRKPGWQTGFATVTVKGTNNAVSSDVNGNYLIQAGRCQFWFSVPGYQAVERLVGNQSDLDISLNHRVISAK